MNQAEQLIQAGRHLDSLLRRLDVPFDEWVKITKASVHVGKIPGVEELAVLCTKENPRPSLAGAITDERQRIAGKAKDKAKVAIALAEEAEKLAGGAVMDVAVVAGGAS